MAIECLRCKAESPDGKRFCGDCGEALDPALVAAKLVEVSIRQQIESVVAERYKDQKLVEVETTQAIAARLSEWAKILGFFIGIPVAALLLVLAVLGIRTYSDFTAQVDKAQVDVTAKLKTAQVSAENLKAESESLANDYDKLRTRFSDTNAIAAQLEALSERVDLIGEKLGFSPTSKVSVSGKKQIEASFLSYQQYLVRLGYRPTSGRIEIDVQDHMDVPGTNAYYDSDKRRMVIDSKFATEATVLYREYMHHVLYADAPPKDSSDRFWAYYSIESALAWYLPCSFVGSPNHPKVASWNLANKRSLKEILPNTGSAMADGTEIWGGAFWEMRQAFGPVPADRLLLGAWFKLRPENVLGDRGATFVKLLLESDKLHASQIREIFSRRGLTV